MNILVLDDEKEIADLVELYLKNDGFNVFTCYSSKDALNIIKKAKLDLAILDVMVDKTNGFDILKEIRNQNLNFPVIMLTAKINDQDKIKGLTLGADDYITKPFNPLELLARVKAIFRRYNKYNNQNSNIIEINGLVIDKNSHLCTLYNKKIDLTPIEFSIVYYLAKNQGKVISSEELFENVWKDKYLDNNNTVMVHIRRIREKFGDKETKIIKTVWGVGYKIEKQ